MCYFLIDTYIDEDEGRGLYDEYIMKVKPVVESYGGRYLVRSEKIEHLSEKRNPQRVIIIHFPDRKHLEQCFTSEAYMKIMAMRTESVDARALIVCDEGENKSFIIEKDGNTGLGFTGEVRENESPSNQN